MEYEEYTYKGFRFCKYRKLVVLSVWGVSLSDIIVKDNSSGIIIPESFRPKNNILTTGNIYLNDNDMHLINMDVRASGEFTFNYWESLTSRPALTTDIGNYFFYISGCWETN